MWELRGSSGKGEGDCVWAGGGQGEARALYSGACGSFLAEMYFRRLVRGTYRCDCAVH